MLNGQVPIEQYHRLKSIRTELLTAREWLVVNLWETLQPTYEELVRRRSEVNGLRLELKTWTLRGQKYTDELAMLQKFVEQRSEANKREADDHRRLRQRLVAENERVLREVEALRQGHQEALGFKKENLRLKEENEILLHKVKLLMPVDTENPGTVKRVHDIEVERSILRKENEYLERKDIYMTEEHKSFKLRIQELEREVETLKESNEKYIKQLLGNNQKNETDAYLKMQQILDKQKLHHYEDLVRQRDNIVSEYDARISLYKDERDEAELKLRALEREHSILKVVVFDAERVRRDEAPEYQRLRRC